MGVGELSRWLASLTERSAVMSASSEDIPVGCGVAMIFLIVALVAAVICVAKWWQDDTERWRKEAVRRGHAEYVLDPTNGTTTWQWKEQVTTTNLP